jgi:hypothetical protein
MGNIAKELILRKEELRKITQIHARENSKNIRNCYQIVTGQIFVCINYQHTR